MRRSKFSLPGCCADRALQTMRLALGYRKDVPSGMEPKSSYHAEDIIANLESWFPRHRCLVGVSIPISRAPCNVVFIGTHFSVPIANYIGIGNEREVFYLPMQDTIVATSFITSARSAHMVVGIPAPPDLIERKYCFILMVFDKSITPHQELRYPIGRYRHDGHELASLFVEENAGARS